MAGEEENGRETTDGYGEREGGRERKTIIDGYDHWQSIDPSSSSSSSSSSSLLLLLLTRILLPCSTAPYRSLDC